MELIISFIVAAVVMGILDYVWLGYVGKKLYYREMGNLLLKKPNMLAALLFYVIYVVGTVVFVVVPALEKESLLYATGMGALFGLVAYATYDLTNLATMKGFSRKIVVIDLLWGALITMLTATGAYLAVQLLS